MRPKATKGACIHCGREYARADMAKHLAKCLMDRLETVKGETSPCLHLQVSSAHTSAYWLHLQVDASATFKALDKFLRDIWVECCGHMSVFRTGHQQIGMGRQLGAFLRPGMEIEYDYDMGDTTSLRIKILGAYPGRLTKKKPVELLARNQPPAIACDECGKNPAIRICPECNWEGRGWLCASCAADHVCGDEEYFLPVANSPRAGVCGYTG